MEFPILYENISSYLVLLLLMLEDKLINLRIIIFIYYIVRIQSISQDILMTQEVYLLRCKVTMSTHLFLCEKNFLFSSFYNFIHRK